MKNDRYHRTTDYVCVECGVPFLTKEQKEEGGFATTFHRAE